MSVKKVDNSDLIGLQKTFYGANGPLDWHIIITETITDLANDLLNFNRDDTEIHYPHAEILKALVLLPTFTTFVKALSLGTEVLFSSRAKLMTS